MSLTQALVEQVLTVAKYSPLGKPKTTVITNSTPGENVSVCMYVYCACDSVYVYIAYCMCVWKVESKGGN